MRTVGVALRIALGMLGLLGDLRGQAEFDRLYAGALEIYRATDADAEQVREAYGRALRAFLQIPPDAGGYGSRLAQGGRAALGAGRPGLALELALELITREGETEDHLALKLQALLEAGDGEGFLGAARAGADRFPGAVQAAVVADRRREPRLLGWADSWLRAGRTDDGLWLFRRLADSGNPIELADLALALRHAGREDESERTYGRALAAAPEDYLIQNDFGLFLRGVGRPREALQVFRRSYALEPRPGDGPAITNLVQMALFHPDLVADPPLESASRALALRPESEMLRRVTLDLLLRESGNPFPGTDPDREARGG